MSDRTSLNENYGNVPKGLESYFRAISEMPTAERIERLNALRSSLEDSEKKFPFLMDKLKILKSMPDVAEYIVVNDETARSLLGKMQECTIINHGDLFQEKYGSVASALVATCILDLFKNAGFIEDVPGLEGVSYRITEKRRNFDY